MAFFGFGKARIEEGTHGNHGTDRFNLSLSKRSAKDISVPAKDSAEKIFSSHRGVRIERLK